MAALKIGWSTNHRTHVALDTAVVTEWAAGAAVVRSPEGWASAEEIETMMSRNAHFRAYLGCLYARHLGLVPKDSIPSILAPDGND
jgi:hypothetical protein